MKQQYVIILDTDFVARKIASILKRPARADDFMDYIFHLRQLPYLEDQDLLLLYLNDNNNKIDLKSTFEAQDSQDFQAKQEAYKARRKVKNSQYAKLIKGGADITARKLEMRDHAFRRQRTNTNQLTIEEFAMDLDEKGIDMEVSLDMAGLAMRENVVAMVVVTKNADFIPAFRFVRMMGVRIILDTIGNKAHKDMLEHSDIVINSRKLFVVDA